MIDGSRLIGFAGTTDLDRARSFYESVLGLEVLEQDDFAVVLDGGGSMLRVNRVAEVATPGYTVLGWEVRDIAAAVADLTGRGATFLRPEGLELDPDGVWHPPGGDGVAWFTDPDGNVLSLSQHAGRG